MKEEEKKEKNSDRAKGRVPTVADSKMYLITAFIAFIDRELQAHPDEANEDFKGLLEASKTALTAAYKLPDDKTYETSREIEDIFFKASRLEIKLPEEPSEENEDAEKESEIEKDKEMPLAESEESQKETEKYEPENAIDEDDVKEEEEEENEPDDEGAEGNGIDIDDDEKMIGDLEKALADDDDMINNDDDSEKTSKESAVVAPAKGRPTRGRRVRK